MCFWCTHTLGPIWTSLIAIFGLYSRELCLQVKQFPWDFYISICFLIRPDFSLQVLWSSVHIPPSSCHRLLLVFLTLNSFLLLFSKNNTLFWKSIVYKSESQWFIYPESDTPKNRFEWLLAGALHWQAASWRDWIIICFESRTYCRFINWNHCHSTFREKDWGRISVISASI